MAPNPPIVVPYLDEKIKHKTIITLETTKGSNTVKKTKEMIFRTC